MLIEHRKFKQALNVVEPARESRAMVPVLQSIRATQVADGLKLEANDLDMNFAATVPVDASNPDDLTDFLIQNPRTVLSAINAAGGKDVSIRVSPGEKDGDHRVAFQAHALKVTQNTGMDPVSDFPTNSSRVVTNEFTAEFTAEVIAHIARVFPAISKEETRYYLNGVHMRKVEGSEWLYRFAATDGRRLHVVDVPLPSAAGDLPSDVIIPRHFIQAVAKLLLKSKHPISFRLGHSSPSNQKPTTTAPDANRYASRCSISGKIGDLPVEFDSKLIDGTYPDYSRVIPTDIPKVVTADIGNLRKAVLAVKSACATRNAPALKFQWTEGSLTVSKVVSDTETAATFTIDCEHNCVGMTAGFNGQLFLDILNSFKGEEITLAMEEPRPSKDRPGEHVQVGGPVLFRDPADTEFQAVLMPMRI